ncbi:hypothetical protein GLOIN_2v1846113 [Rhizophagus irregularis DAOM 181602=DAOM 197198]|uniref:Ion transport domain-containing protein n=1 Tax=Rhizophagus irregularis (strain DAOM 181602 / DAOM 197198 / MUCL 43194) TaxID=747089 RepID=A0A2P4PCG5_RHIID|nr:hypothetical protein GLOIN_2v1846113 [Rhizophagus irregularis DAOM 181602=DAOM 197198]POG63086.1 hypothetical protein GLOIN_2v1846113 [Rhizophagus irregularis DAOM 181602=DAOM 197198]|eukprot:XP_025169952.1 hypothetical protein GLOIN_2v1846113 [Rhizophagus irregularis DAOM 181602=DAOM 197198]
MNEISVEIDKTIKNDKIDVDIDKPHNGKQINMIEVSPNGSYLVTYSPEDDSIIGWNVKDIDDMDDMDGGQLKPEPNHHHIDNNVKLTQLSVSDDKEIAYICDNKLKMINMNNNQEIELPYEKLCINYHYCTFFRTPFGFIQFIHCSDVKDRHGTDQKIIFIYPTRIKNKKLTCKGIYKIPENFELISLSKYGKVYLLSNNYVYAWDISTKTSIRIFVNEKDEECKRDSIEISSDIKFVCLRIKNKIIVYSFELEIPIASLNNDIQLYNFIKHTFHIGLFPLLFPLLNSGFRNSVMEYYWKKCLNRYQNDILPDIIQITTTGYAFGILDGDVWKIKMSDELDNEIYDKIKTKVLDFNAEETFENLNIYLFNPFLKNSLFREIISDSNRKEAIELNTNSTKWEIKITDGKLEFQISNNVWNLIYTNTDFSFEKRTNNNDPNNPWNLASTYSKVLDDGTIDSNPYIIQPPNENTNMFIDYRTAIFAVYLFLTGDSSSLTNWTYMNNPSLVILIVLFSFLIVVYLMNLFIGLLNLEIDKSNDRVFLLIQKAKILAEIELFYLLPNQRRLEKWFPEVIYYCADVDITRAEVKKLITDGRWSNEFPDMKKDLFKKINIQRNPAEVDLRKLLEEVQSKLKNITYL